MTARTPKINWNRVWRAEKLALINDASWHPYEQIKHKAVRKEVERQLKEQAK